jgi:hypothetical protein
LLWCFTSSLSFVDIFQLLKNIFEQEVLLTYHND